MTREEFRTALGDKGLQTQESAARELGLTQQSISRYLNGARPIPAVVAVALRAVRRRRSTKRGSK